MLNALAVVVLIVGSIQAGRVLMEEDSQVGTQGPETAVIAMQTTQATDQSLSQAVR